MLKEVFLTKKDYFFKVAFLLSIIFVENGILEGIILGRMILRGKAYEAVARLYKENLDIECYLIKLLKDGQRFYILGDNENNLGFYHWQ